ncbi:tagaturonate reductase [Metabacillus sp. YM-086]|uniref:tagaturonate reductase n=1 Tax=Metabacillus sp. YM-086 TaxID=3341729 RepID=UPI003A8507EC
MDQLCRETLLENQHLTERAEVDLTNDLPERILQFGEGNFLRGFVDWMVNEMNKQGIFNGRVVAIQPTPHGKVVPKLNAQDGLYTLVQQGIKDGKTVNKSEVITSISRGINPYENWDEVLKVAESPSIQFVFSNTTEAGLTYLAEEFIPDASPLSFPGKLTAVLYHRYRVFNGSEDSGLTIIPCELVEENANVLREIVLKIANDWELPQEFIQWVEQNNRFCNTLVDRIVPGYPKENIDTFTEMLGYEDQLIAVCEPYHLFVIDGDKTISESIPFHQAGLQVKWGDVTPYRQLKVSLLNAPHTMMYSLGYLSGLNTVYEVMENSELFSFIENAIKDEIKTVLSFETKVLDEFANSVLDRFKNPFVKHYLVDLGQNAVSKYKARVLPLFFEYLDKQNKIPVHMVFSLSGLIAYYRPIRVDGDEHMVGNRDLQEYQIRDSKDAVKTFAEAWNQYDGTSESLNKVVSIILSDEKLWGRSLVEISLLKEMVVNHLEDMVTLGVQKSLEKFYLKN